MAWDGAEIRTVPVHAADDGSLLKITSYRTLESLMTNRRECGLPAEGHHIAQDITRIAGDRVSAWPECRELMPLAAPCTRALAPYGIARSGPGHVRTDDVHGRHIDQGYGAEATGAHLRITVRVDAVEGLRTETLPRDAPPRRWPPGSPPWRTPSPPPCDDRRARLVGAGPAHRPAHRAPPPGERTRPATTGQARRRTAPAGLTYVGA